MGTGTACETALATLAAVTACAALPSGLEPGAVAAGPAFAAGKVDALCVGDLPAGLEADATTLVATGATGRAFRASVFFFSTGKVPLAFVVIAGT